MGQKTKSEISEIATPYSGSVRGSKTNITNSDAEQLQQFFDENGVFTIDVETFNSKVGLNDKKARAWQIKRILNKQFSNLLDENQEWRVGQTAKNTKYVFSIRAKKDKEE